MRCGRSACSTAAGSSSIRGSTCKVTTVKMVARALKRSRRGTVSDVCPGIRDRPPRVRPACAPSGSPRPARGPPRPSPPRDSGSASRSASAAARSAGRSPISPCRPSSKPTPETPSGVPATEPRRGQRLEHLQPRAAALPDRDDDGARRPGAAGRSPTSPRTSTPSRPQPRAQRARPSRRPRSPAARPAAAADRAPALARGSARRRGGWRS